MTGDWEAGGGDAGARDRVDARADHGTRADVLHAVLQERFWSPRHRLYRIADGRGVRPFGPWHHWWQSHALAALLDRRDRTGDPAVEAQAEDLVEGIRHRGHGLTNEFYDDMGWLALELLRMPGHDADVRALLAAIRAGEAPEGGIAWSTEHPEKRNTPATGPAALLALRLGAWTGDEALLDWGLMLLRWLEETVVTPDGVVHDGQLRHADGSLTIDQPLYSYNFGLVVAAELAAYRVTGDAAHLEQALLVASAAVPWITEPSGVWRSEGRGDGALFRAIFARHLTDLALATADQQLAAAVSAQADAISAAGQGGPTGHDWTRPPDHRVDLSEHLCALLVVESAARLSGG